MKLHKNILALAACSLLLTLFATIAWTAWLGKCATFDEPLDFASAWIQTHYGDFRCDPEDPPLSKYVAVLGTNKAAMKVDRDSREWGGMLTSMVWEGAFFRDFLYHTPENNADQAIRSGRARMIWLGILLGGVIAWWAWRVGGPVAAVAASACFCFDPNFLAHTPLIKDDVTMSLSFLLLMGTIWLLGERATPPRWAAAALLLGAALTVKFSGLLAIPMVAIALLCRAMLPAPWPVMGWMARTRMARCAVAVAMGIAMLLVAYGLVWACYGFRFAPARDPAPKFDLSDVVHICRERECMRDIYKNGGTPRSQLARMEAQWRPNAPVRVALWANRHRLLPQAYLVGFLFTYGTTRVRLTFLMGQSSMLGWWYYFPLAMAFKTPLATLAALALAAGFWIWRGKWKTRRDYWPLCAAALCPILYLGTAMAANLNLGLRHVLPVYPYLFVLIGAALAKAWEVWPRLVRATAGLLLVGLVTETVCAFPNFIPFFNVAAGGSRGGIALLGDSNIDWGQDLPALAAWQQEHPDRQLLLYYFGTADPRCYGIHYVNLEGSNAPADQAMDSSLPSVYALSATAFQDTPTSLSEPSPYLSFEKRTPAAVLGGCIYVFDGSDTPEAGSVR